MRQHGTLWDTGQTRTLPDKSSFVRDDESLVFPDRHGHTPKGVSSCPNRRGAVQSSTLNGSFLVAAGRGGRRAAENQSLQNFEIGLHRGG